MNGDTSGRRGGETRVGGGAALDLAFLGAGIEGVDIEWERFFDGLGRVGARVGGLAGLLRLLGAIENTTEDRLFANGC